MTRSKEDVGCDSSARGDHGGGPYGHDPVLTPREVEAVTLAAEGLPAKCIGTRMGICCKTVEAHLGSARHKLGARNVAHLIALAIRRGLITVLCIVSLGSGVSDTNGMRPARGGGRIVRVSRGRSRRRWEQPGG